MTLAEILAEARRLDEAATPGPWTWSDGYDGGTCVAIMRSCDRSVMVEGPGDVWPKGHEATNQNAAFIAFSRTALPRLVAVAEAAMEMRKAERDDPNSMDAPYPVGPRAVHCYGCPATKVGKKTGPCNCGGDAMQARINASRAAFDAAARGEP